MLAFVPLPCPPLVCLCFLRVLSGNAWHGRHHGGCGTYNVTRRYEPVPAPQNPETGVAARAARPWLPDAVTWAVPCFSGSRTERSKQEMPFMTNSSIRVPHSERYVPKHIVHDTTRYITIEGDDDAKAGDSGKVDYMDISDVSVPGAIATATDDGNGNSDQTPDIAETTPENAAEGVTGVTDATTEAAQIDVDAETTAPDDADDQATDERAAQRIAELSDRLAKALDAEHDAEAKRDQAFKDLNNYKRRMEDEKERARREAVADVGKAVMPAIDDLERVIEHYAAQNDDETLAAVASGCDGIRRKLLGSLTALGIEQIDPTGKEFDPDTSMAIAHEPRDGYEPNTVYATYQKGYKIGDKVIRTATVGVAK